MVYKCLHGQVPDYLSELCMPVAQVAEWQHLCSASCNLLVTPRFQLDMYGRCAFAVAAPATWSSLSDDLRNLDLHSATFRHNLKTFLFQQYLMHWAHQRHCAIMRCINLCFHLYFTIYIYIRCCVFCLLIVLVKLSVLAKWLARKTPLRKPNRSKGIFSRKLKPKSVYDYLCLLYCFIVLWCVGVVPRPYVIYFLSYGTIQLFVLKVPLNTNQPTNEPTKPQSDRGPGFWTTMYFFVPLNITMSSVPNCCLNSTQDNL